MKRTLPFLAVLLVLTLSPGCAQDETPADSAGTAGTAQMDQMQETDQMDQMQQMMQVHEQMMADPVLRQHVVANTSMQTAIDEMMGPEMAAMHEQMASVPPDERQQMQQQMHASMMERMEAMSPEEFQAFHERMVEAHGRMLDDPEVREHMMADPEMRPMMERMHEDGMMQDDGSDDSTREDSAPESDGETGDERSRADGEDTAEATD